MTRIAVVGSLNMDLVVRTPRIPKPGETIIGSDFKVVPGGKGANQAVAAGKLCGDVGMIGRVGNDNFGTALLENLQRNGVKTDYVQRDSEAPTGIALITVEDSGQNNIVLAPGANMRLTIQDIDAAEECIAGASVLITQLESPLPTVAHALVLAKRYGVTTIFNPAPAQPLGPEVLQYVDVLIPNETETSLLTGLPVETEEQFAMAAARLRSLGVRTVILTLGDRGACLATETETSLFPAYKVRPVDTTAAGDAFVGAFAVALAEGQPLDVAVKKANAAGALSTTKFGAQPSMPTREEWEQFCRERGC